ncbi:MAG TPA: helix-turn-helix domain-containing protein [Acidimicrobiales bacterium]|nr:helix-turn-helix domain-containing protein [Acidimicrobiales bacterium]
MAKTEQDGGSAVADAARSEGPRRSALLQDRSRRTRRALVRAALALWTERGFDRGVEETTVEEIASAAGVTKGTFYFHFAHKEDILLELGWGTAEALYEEAAEGVAEDRPADELLDDLLVSLARRVSAAPKVAVARSVAQFLRRERSDDDTHHFGFRRAFRTTLELAREQGSLPPTADVKELSVMLEVLAMDALSAWAYGRREPLLETLRTRSAIVLAGAAQSQPAPSRARRTANRAAV